MNGMGGITDEKDNGIMGWMGWVGLRMNKIMG